MLNPIFFAGATSAPCLIFIFPAVFYIRIVPKEDEPSFSVPKVLVSNLCIRVNRQRRAERKIKMMWKQLWGLLVGRQTPAVMSVGPLSLSLALPGCLLCWDWLPVYDNEPQLHHHRLDLRQQQRQQWPLSPTFYSAGFIVSVVTVSVSVLNDCRRQCCPAWAEGTYCPPHVTSQCTVRPAEQASRF